MDSRGGAPIACTLQSGNYQGAPGVDLRVGTGRAARHDPLICHNGVLDGDFFEARRSRVER